MNIINLRNVGSYEITDSFRSILRISPNIIGDAIVDDASEILNDTTQTIYLSDSTGNKLPISFIPKTYSTILDDRDGLTEIIYLSINTNKLFISENLNIKQTLYITLKDETTPPIIVSDGQDALGYPPESPDDDKYFNFKNSYNFDKEKTWKDNLSLIPLEDDIYKEDVSSEQWVKVNGEYVYNYVKYDGKHHKLPMLKKRDYIIGTRSTDRYNISKAVNTIHNIERLKDYQTSGTYTQLSFLPLESILYTNLEDEVRGIYRSPARGRYTNLNLIGSPTEDNNTKNKLAETLFSKTLGSGYTIDSLEAELNKKSPIIGISVQPGTIHYNAIPAHRYFFHLSRRYSGDNLNDYVIDNSGTITAADDTVSSSINNIITQYVLCDGKNIATDYPAIDSNSFNINWSDTHDAIRNSIMGAESTEKTFRTPPLFDCDQLSLRFLRGLNWLRSADEDGLELYNTKEDTLNSSGSNGNEANIYFINNDKKYYKIDNENDAGNHSKNIHQVGLHLASIDNALQRNWKHCHLGFGATTNNEVNLDPDAEGDTLNEYRNYFAGFSNEDDYCPVKKDSTDYSDWKSYVHSWLTENSSSKFAGSTILPTMGGLSKKSAFNGDYEYLRNYPIINVGGSSSYWWNINGCLRFGKRKFKCMNHRTRTHGISKIRDGKYTLASALPIETNINSLDGENTESSEENIDTAPQKGWRFVTSLPELNKYDDISISIPNDKKSRIKYHKSTSDDSGIQEIDDNLPSPPAVNFIPLMKI